MKIFDILRMALKNLFRSKVRTTLTVLGIVIGTTAIIIMLSLGIAMNVAFKEQMSKMGSMNVITVYPNYEKMEMSRSRSTEWVEPKISQSELEQISKLPNVQAITPFYQTNVKMIIGKYVSYVNIVGIEPDAMEALEYKPGRGRLLTSEDTLQIVFGANMKDQFYDPKSSGRSRFMYSYSTTNEEKDFDFLEDRIDMSFDMSYGERIPGNVTQKKPKVYRLEGVGVLQEGDWETAYQAYMNIHELQKLNEEYKKSINNTEETNRRRNANTEVGYQQARVKVAEIKDVLGVQEQIRALGLNAFSMAESLESANKTSAVMQGILGGIGAISLLVAAIGIANTMIMAIYERTKEIGIMKVIGARLKDIKRLFLYEASMIGFIGGVIGIAFSFGVSYLLNTIGAQFMSVNLGMGSNAKLSIIPVWLAVSGMVFSAFIGLVSGFFPAQKATKLSALSAIHTE